MPNNAELDKLEAEAVGMAPQQVEPSQPEDQCPDLDEQGLKEALTPAIKGLGDVACRRMQVPDIAPEEAAAIAGSIAKLMSLYNIGPKDPKGAAWMGFGLTVLGVVGPRFRARPVENIEATTPPAGDWNRMERNLMERGLGDHPPKPANAS